MTKSRNYETRSQGTKDGSVKFGHIHEDQVKSSVLIQGQESLEYIVLDQTEPRKRWITSRCRGRYQVKSGDDIPKDAIGMYFDASNSDIVIRTGGRIRMEAENIDLIARGNTNSSGVINIHSNESVNIKTKKFTTNADESISLFSDGQIQQTAINIMSIYAGDCQRMCAKSAINPPIAPVLQNIKQYTNLNIL
jgi:hypothetical protein